MRSGISLQGMGRNYTARNVWQVNRSWQKLPSLVRLRLRLVRPYRGANASIDSYCRADRCLDRFHSEMAAQQKLGILPQWWRGFDPGDSSRPLLTGSFVSGLAPADINSGPPQTFPLAPFAIVPRA